MKSGEENMLNIVKKMIEKLEENGIRYVHFKSNEHLNESIEGETDFDILVARASAQKYEQCLLELNFKKFCSVAHSSYPGVDDWIGFDDVTGRLIHMHTHYQLVTGKSGYKNYVLPWAETALDCAQVDEKTGMKIASAEFELVELYTRIIAKMAWNKNLSAMSGGYALKGGTLREAQWLWERADRQKMPDMLQRCFGEYADDIDAAVFWKKSLTAKEYRSFRCAVLKKLQFHERSGMSLVNARSSFYKGETRVVRKLKKMMFVPSVRQKKICHTGGLLIAFLGVDGSGKTTVTSEINKWLGWKFETSHMSLGIGRKKQTLSYKIRQKLKAFLKKGGGKQKTGKPVSLDFEKPIKVNGKNYRKQRVLVRFAKAVHRDIMRIHSYCLNGGIMVVDRYPQLQYFGIADGRKVNPAFPKLQKEEENYLKIAEEIQPDLVFKLVIPVELSKERRPEDSVEILQKKWEILHAVDYPKAKVIEVDATQPLDKELIFIKQKIWEML